MSAQQNRFSASTNLIVEKTIAAVVGNISRKVDGTHSFGSDPNHNTLSFIRELQRIIGQYDEPSVKMFCDILRNASKPIYNNIKTRTEMLTFASSLIETPHSQHEAAFNRPSRRKQPDNNPTVTKAPFVAAASRKEPRPKTPKEPHGLVLISGKTGTHTAQAAASKLTKKLARLKTVSVSDSLPAPVTASKKPAKPKSPGRPAKAGSAIERLEKAKMARAKRYRTRRNKVA